MVANYTAILLFMKEQVTKLLRWSEKYTKTDMVYLTRGGFWLTVGQTASSLSSFALAIAFANLVPPETYGTYKYLLSIAGIFAIFTLPGMTIAVTRAVAQGHEGVLHATTRSRLIFSLVGSMAALLGSGYYLYNENIELSLALLIIAVTLPIFDTLTGYLAYFAGKRRFDLQAKYHIITQLISVSSLIVALFLTDNVLILLLTYFLSLSFIRAIFYQHTLKKIEKTADKIQEKEVLAYGNHLTAMNIIGTISSNIDKVLLWTTLGPVDVAVYTFALAIPEQLKGPLKGINELSLPKFAVQTAGQIRANMPVLWRKLFLYALILLSISLIYIILAPYIFKFLFPQYLESVIYSQIFMIASVALIGNVPLSLLSAHKKIKEQYIFTTIHPIAQIVAYVILIPLFGIAGAIAARVILRVFFVIFTTLLMRQAFRA